MAKVIITIETDLVTGTLEDKMQASDGQAAMEKIASFLQGASGGTYAATVTVDAYQADDSTIDISQTFAFGR